MRNLNVNIDPSNAPTWLTVMLLLATLAAELLQRPIPPREALPGPTLETSSK